MENCRVSSKLSPPGKTGQSWGCSIYKNSRRVAYIRSPREECHSLHPRFPFLLLLVARNGVQGPFPTRVPDLLCVPSNTLLHRSSLPFLGEDLEGRSMIKPPWYTVCWFFPCNANLDGHSSVQGTDNHPPFLSSKKAESSSHELEIMQFFRYSSKQYCFSSLQNKLNLVSPGQFKVSAEHPWLSQGRRLRAFHSCD